MKRTIHITAKTGDLTGNNIDDKIRKYQDTVTNEHDKETPKERFLFPEEIPDIVGDLRLI